MTDGTKQTEQAANYVRDIIRALRHRTPLPSATAPGAPRDEADLCATFGALSLIINGDNPDQYIGWHVTGTDRSNIEPHVALCMSLLCLLHNADKHDIETAVDLFNAADPYTVGRALAAAYRLAAQTIPDDHELWQT